MVGAGALWLALLVLCPVILSLPLPEERDSEDSRKVLGSSVVTSVSVVLDNNNGNGTATAHFADAVGRPVGRPVGADDIGSPVGLLTPDRYQFFTFDADGNLVKRYMTKDEVRSIIANGQKKGETPTFYHNAPTAEGVDAAAALVVNPTEEHSEQLASQLKMHRVVESVQNVLKSQLASAPASESVPTPTVGDLPGAPDPGASWSMILPSYLGNVAEDHESPDNASTESLMVGDAPVASMESGSGDREHEEVTEGVEKTEKPMGLGEEATEVSSETTEQATEEETEHVQEQTPEQETGHLQEQTTEQATELVEEQTTEEEKEQSNEHVQEPTTEQVHEQVEEQETEKETEKSTEQSTEHDHEESTEQLQDQSTKLVEEEEATEPSAVLQDDEPEDVSEGSEDEVETTTLPVELKQNLDIANDEDEDEDEDVAAPTTEAEDAVETTLVSESPSSSTTERTTTTPSASTEPVKLSTPASAEIVSPVTSSDEMHADAPVSSSSEEDVTESASTEKQAEDKVTPTETPEESVEDIAEVTELTTEAESITDLMDVVLLDDAEEKESFESVPMDDEKEKESLKKESLEKESLEKVSLVGDSSASVAVSEDKSANNMVDTSSKLSSEVRHPSDTKHSPEETRPEGAASEAVSVEQVTVKEAATELQDSSSESESDESTEEGDTTTTPPAPAVETTVNATLNDLNVTQTLGDALSSVLQQVAQDALAEVDADADGEGKVVVTSVSSSHSSHSTSSSVSSSKESDTSASKDDKEKVQPVEVLSPTEGDDKDKVKRHNKPVEEVVVEKVEYSPVALIHPDDSNESGDSDESSDSEDVMTLRPSSTPAATSAEFIPISDEQGAASGEHKHHEVEDVTAKAGSGDGEGSGDGDDDGEGSGALPAIYNVMEYASSDADFGVTLAMTSPAPAQSDEHFPRDSSHEAEDSTADYEASKSTEFDVHKYVAGDKDVGLTTSAPAHSTASEENSSMYDVNKYADSDTDLGITTPSHDAEELNDASMTDKKSTTTEQSGENSSMYDVNKYANGDTDLGITTPSHDSSEQNDASVSDQKSTTTTEQSGENSSMYDVNKYVNGDTDLGVTTPSQDADVEELNDEGNNLSAENIFDVNNYVVSDKDLGVTTTSSSEDSVNHSSDLYDVNKYVTSDDDLGLTTPQQEASTEPASSTSQEAVKSEESTTASTEGSGEGNTTPFDADMMMNDGADDADASHLFKSPLAGVVAPNWTPVAVISPHDTTPGIVDLRPAPGESLGLEASTANLFEDVHNFAALCNELAFRMWLSATGKGVSAARSLVMSPFAITSLLSMIFLGAKGPTSGQMNDILRLDDMMTFNPHQVFRNVTESLLLEKLPGVATAAFVRQLYSDKNKGRMLDFYKQRASGFYDGHVEEVDFKTIGDIVRRRTNMLIKKQTGGKIGEYMRGSNLELQPPLAAFGANVFQTDCSSASSAGRDGEMYFTVLPTTRHRRLVPVPAVVYRSGFLAGYEPSLDATVVSLGGGDADVSTLLVLPGQQGQLAPGDGLPQLEARLFAAPFADAAWSKLLRSLLPRAGLEVQLPRFSHRSQLNMTHSLQSMGLNDLFDPLNADLKGLSGSSGDLHVSDIVQINTFSTCAEAGVGAQHHVEIYPGTPQRAGREDSEVVSGDQEDLANVPLALRPRQARIDLSQETDSFEESVYQMPLALRPRQAREPEESNLPRLKFDRPFLYFVRHNPTGFILHMGRFNPRLLN